MQVSFQEVPGVKIRRRETWDTFSEKNCKHFYSLPKITRQRQHPEGHGESVDFRVFGLALKNIPAGYEKEHPQAEYLKYKSWYLEYPIQNKDLVDNEQRAADIFRRMKPFNDYLNQALADFQMPKK
nr:DUF2461 family protein [uncultured Oscillibacter sp.]